MVQSNPRSSLFISVELFWCEYTTYPLADMETYSLAYIVRVPIDFKTVGANCVASPSRRPLNGSSHRGDALGQVKVHPTVHDGRHDELSVEYSDFGQQNVGDDV